MIILYFINNVVYYAYYLWFGMLVDYFLTHTLDIDDSINNKLQRKNINKHYL